MTNSQGWISLLHTPSSRPGQKLFNLASATTHGPPSLVFPRPEAHRSGLELCEAEPGALVRPGQPTRAPGGRGQPEAEGSVQQRVKTSWGKVVENVGEQLNKAHTSTIFPEFHPGVSPLLV